MLLFLAVAAAVPIHFHFDATEFADAVYHTVCVTGRIPCTRKIYERSWNEKYHATPEDRAHFAEFGKIFDDLESLAKPQPPTPFLQNDFWFDPGFHIRNRLVAAALASKSPSDFRKRAAALAKPEQAEKLAAILAYFEQRLHPWWVATGQPIVKSRFPGIEQQLKAQRAPVLASEVAAFLETEPSSRDYYMHAVPSPEYENGEANGTALLDQFCLEVSKRIEPGVIGWFALHELTHSLYDQAPQKRKDTLMRQFVDSGDELAHPMYLYLNEALATAVELVFAERIGKTIDEPYTEMFIPRLGQAALPLVRAALEKRQTLYDGFTAPYLAAGRASLGEDAGRLQFRYSVVALLAEDDVRDAFLDRFPLRYTIHTQEAWSRFSRLDGILMLRYEQVHFGDDVEIQALMQKHRGFVYIQRNNEHMDVFMLGRDNAAVEDLGKMWAETKEKAREGLIFAIE